MKFLFIKRFLTPPQRQVLILVMLVLTIGIAAIVGLLSTQAMPNYPNETQVMARLTALQTQLTSVEHAMSKPQPPINIDQQIAQLTEHLEQLRAANAEQLNQTLNHTETTLSSQLNDIQTVVNHLDAKALPVKYLKPENLPFNVVSLDSIQQIPVASIAYDFKVIPLEKGDMMAGWTLLSLDYGKQRLEFENTKKERVVVTHEYIG